MSSEMSQSGMDSDVQMTMTPMRFGANLESTPTNDHLGGGDHAPSHPQTPSQVSLPTSHAQTRIHLTGDIDDVLAKLLECPVCYDLVCPPIINCVRGHNCCETCREKVVKCPLCREDFSPVRNLFAEQFLEKCNFKSKCKFGCMACLPAKDLNGHYHDICPYRPIRCRECDRMILYSEFLDHVQKVDKLQRQRASECSTGFEIEEGDLDSISPRGRRNTVWEPTWMSCFGQDFFCFLDFNGTNWWIWVSSLTSEGCDFKCQIILWSKVLEEEFSYFGTIHSIRTEPDDVLLSGSCLFLTKQTVRNFMHEGGIDVLVRIEHNYTIPKTRRGMDVQSPLDIMGQNHPAAKRQRIGHHSDQEQQDGQLNATLTTFAEDRRAYTRLRRQGESHESRIPVSVASTPTTASFSLDPTSAPSPSPQGRNLSTILPQFQDQVSGATNNEQSVLRASSQTSTSSSLIANYSTESIPLTRPRRFFLEDLEAGPTGEREPRGLTFTPTLTSTPTATAGGSRVRRVAIARGRFGQISSTSGTSAEAIDRFGNEE